METTIEYADGTVIDVEDLADFAAALVDHPVDIDATVWDLSDTVFDSDRDIVIISFDIEDTHVTRESRPDLAGFGNDYNNIDEHLQATEALDGGWK